MHRLLGREWPRYFSFAHTGFSSVKEAWLRKELELFHVKTVYHELCWGKGILQAQRRISRRENEENPATGFSEPGPRQEKVCCRKMIGGKGISQS
jgi:hypothetical protein